MVAGLDFDLFVFDMNDRMAALRLFVRVARTGSFSRAGRELGVSQPSTSRIIAALERDVGTALLTRTTRAVVLTEAGSEYLARIEPILDALEEANQAARGTREVRGVLRVGLPTSIAIREVIPRLRGFLDLNPAASSWIAFAVAPRIARREQKVCRRICSPPVTLRPARRSARRTELARASRSATEPSLL